MSKNRTCFLLSLLPITLLAACSPSERTPGDDGKLRVVATTPVAHRTLARAEASPPSDRPLLRGRTPEVPAAAAAWVCRRGVCSLPIADAAALRAALLATR